MKTLLKKWTAVTMTIVLVLSMMIPAMFVTVSAGTLADATGGSVVDSSTVTNGLTYEKVTFSKASKGQTGHVLEFNPSTSGLVALPYQVTAGTGATVGQSIADAQANGYTVYGAVNGEFFSPSQYANAGTLTGRLLTNGRIISDHEGLNEQCIAIGNDGSIQVVKSELAYHFYIEGTEILQWNGAPVIARVNKRYNENWGYDPLCYFDSSCGTKTDTISDYPGVEVVFNKVNGSELVVEGILEGEVVSVGTNTYGTSFGEDQFVLYAYANSAHASQLAALKAGQKVQIYVEEKNADAKDIMKNAISVSSATYHIVKDGVDNTDYTPNATDIYLKRAQRTAIGIKADGTQVIMCVAGRGASSTNNAGVTLPELADIMINMGCVDAFNLDGGGSSVMYINGSPVYRAAADETPGSTYERPVGSAILIVDRSGEATSASAKQELNNWIYNANTSTYPNAKVEADVKAAVAEANAVLNNANSMTGDFLRETLDIKRAMGVIEAVGPKDYISLNAKDWSYDGAKMVATNDADGALVLSNTDGQWPSATLACAVTAKATDNLYYDITVNGQSSLMMKVNGQDVSLNSLIAAGSLDSGSGDIVGGGKTFKGSIPVSKILDGGFELTSVTLWAVGGAGDPSKVTVRELEFRDPYSGGDINGSGTIDSSDARLLMRYIVGKQTLTAQQIAAADVNGDGVADTNDVRLILAKRVGLA